MNVQLLKASTYTLLLPCIFLLVVYSADRYSYLSVLSSQHNDYVQLSLDRSKVEHNQKKAISKNIDWGSLSGEIDMILGEDSKNYSYFIQNLYTKEYIANNEEDTFHPASIYKVPLALAILHKIEEGEVGYDQKLLVTENQIRYSFDPLAKRDLPFEVSVRELLEYLICYSDNTAMTTLEHRLGGVYDLQETYEVDLGIKGITRLPGKTNAKSVAALFRGIYEEKYLDSANNEFLLSLLKDIAPGQNDRIPAGVPEDIEVAHKIGTLDRVYQDAGIVYGQRSDYIIVVLNKDINQGEAREKIQEISEITYRYLSN